MLPKFPEFKKLELSDQAEIEKITSRYEPYSDFNFENMWAWDINDSIEISTLNNNFLLLTRNIFSEEWHFTYLGGNELDKTLDNIFEFLSNRGMALPKVNVVPEASLQGLNFNKYFIEFDINSCDYVYDLQELSLYSGNKFMQKRGRKNSFVRNYPDTEVRVMNLHDEDNRNAILALNKSWQENKAKSDMDVSKEMLAIKRFIEADFKNAYCLGVYRNGLIGYAIFSFHGNDFVINHFIKADTAYIGVYEFFMQACAILLTGLGYKFLNYLEDMGLPGLRQAKLTYRPIKFLKKYSVNKL